LRLKRIGYYLDSLPRPPVIMQLIENQGVKSLEMYKTFNMGIGFCVIAPKNQASKIKSIFRKNKIQASQIGKITNKTGVFINSKKIA